MKYQWRRNVTNIRRESSETYMGNFTNTATDNGSQFDEVVSNAMESVTSAAATLTINSTGLQREERQLETRSPAEQKF